MAVSGTLTQVFNPSNVLSTAISGMTQGSSSQVFGIKGYPFTSYVVQGTAGAAFSGQWQVSNDGGTTFTNLGAAITTLPASGTLTPNSEPFDLYQFVITGGDGTTNVAINVRATRAG